MRAVIPQVACLMIGACAIIPAAMAQNPQPGADGRPPLLVRNDQTSEARTVKAPVQQSVVTRRPATSPDDKPGLGGDFSKALSAESFTVTNDDPANPVMGKPSGAKDYTYTPQAEPHFLDYRYGSGWNQLPDNQGGRTGANAYDTRLNHTGQGDLTAYFSACHIGAAKHGATNFLANPACSIMAGIVALDPGGVGGYLQGSEVHLTDHGVEGAAIGHVVDLDRSSAKADLGEVGMGLRPQSTGPVPADVGLSIAGRFRRGVDTATAELSDEAAFTVAAGQRIYFNATAAPMAGVGWFATNPGTTYQQYKDQVFATVVDGNPTLQVGGGAVTVAGGLTTAKAMVALGGYRQPLQTPAQGSPCEPGQFRDDTNYHYVCVAANTWKRAALQPY